MDRKRQHCRAVTSLALLERARAWEWVKDPPAGEGQVGQKHLFGKGGTGRIEKRGYILSSLTFLPTGAEVFLLPSSPRDFNCWLVSFQSFITSKDFNFIS